MWILTNDTPFAAERTLACDRNGADVWLVAVKGTFLINTDGSVKIAEKQEEVLQAPQHRAKPSKSSLLYESDLDYTKLTTDVILNGHAYAPAAKPVPQIDVTMKVGNTSKTLRVFGDRLWKKRFFGIRLTRPEPFEMMPIIYERAFGGGEAVHDKPKQSEWDRRNPVGRGFASRSRHQIDRCAPNIEYPQMPSLSWKHKAPPAGFGPVARHWSPRAELAGTYDEQWRKERFPLLPKDFNERFFQCAPIDQQSEDYLHGGELVELHNLSREGFIQFHLPRVALGFQTRLAGKVVHHGAKMHSVILEPDIPRVIMVWHTMLQCHGKRFSLEGTSIIQKRYVHKGQL